jgi:hypothetical protein
VNTDHGFHRCPAKWHGDWDAGVSPGNADGDRASL